MKKRLLFVFCALLAMSIGAQENVLSSGKKASSSSGTVNYSVGLVHYEVSSGSGGSSSTGVQLPIEVTTLSSIDQNLTTVNVYPNPTKDFISVNLNGQDHLSYRIVDILGKTLLSGNFIRSQNSVDIRNLKSSLYFLIISNGNKSVQTYQIIKK